MGALVTSEADSMSPLRFGMRQADKAMWADMGFCKDKGISEKKKYRRYRTVVQACVHHSSEGSIRTKELIDTVHG